METKYKAISYIYADLIEESAKRKINIRTIDSVPVEKPAGVFIRQEVKEILIERGRPDLAKEKDEIVEVEEPKVEEEKVEEIPAEEPHMEEVSPETDSE